MFSIYQIKPWFQGLLRPLVIRLHARGVTANQVTLLAWLISMLLGAALLLWGAAHPALFALLPLWMLLRMAMNAIDGMLAREHDQKTPLGAYFNELTDVVADAALYLPFAFLPGVQPWLVAGVVFLAALSEYAGVLGLMVGASRRYDGPFGKSDRAFAFGLLGLLVSLGALSAGWQDGLMALMILALLATCTQRIRHGLAEGAARRTPPRPDKK